jgi:glycerol-3-phosphate acyltransferase PlsY
MMEFWYRLAILLGAFLIGSIPFGLLVARAFKVKDLTERGSGNIGTTNVSRVLGFWPAGFITLLLDVLKGAGPVALLAFTGVSESLGALMQVPESAAHMSPLLLWSAGLFCVLGHCFSPWLHFNGGKGVATGVGVILVLSPLSALVGLVGFVCAFMLTGVGAMGSLTGLVFAAAAYLVMNPVGAHVWAGAAILFVILVRHESNLDRMLENRENKFS